MPDPGYTGRDMKLAIVGAVCLSDSETEVKRIIYAMIEKYKPTHIVSGGAEGVDTFAEEVCKELGLDPIIHRPAGRGWTYYKPRNLQIAQDCDVLIRITSVRSKTYGSGWTRDRAVEMGKDCEEFILP